jgi:hypothetical protein
MKTKGAIEEPPIIAKPEVDLKVFEAIHPEWLNDSFVYVHCHFENATRNMFIRIWPTTFLLDAVSNARSRLVHAENITLAPQWTMLPDSQAYAFLLIFEALPKSCRQFDLVEEVNQPGRFIVLNIARNETDVYHVNIAKR